MFPTGTAGVALLVLRLSVAASLVADGTQRGALVASYWLLLTFLGPALLLMIGFLTPYASAFTCLAQLWVFALSGSQHNFHLLLSVLNSVVVAMLGPGAYSIDAHLFGRRLLAASPRK
jgi:uncharacterized membrane protein YphA (DoxX/SURF4 family)